MTAQEYTDFVLLTRNNLYEAIRGVLPAECEMEKLFIMGSAESEQDWVGALVNDETDYIRLFVLLMTDLKSSDVAKTAGARNFKPSMKINFELFHDHLQGTDANNSQTAFESDALKIQFAIESNRNLSAKAYIDDYDLKLGVRRSKVRTMHYGRGELTINFREIRYA